MARLQILELPEGANDDRAPFVLVVDQYEPRRYEMGLDQTEQPINELDASPRRSAPEASSSSQTPSTSPPTTSWPLPHHLRAGPDRTNCKH